MVGSALHFSVQPRAEAAIVLAISELSASLKGIANAPQAVVDSLLRFLQIGDGLADIRSICSDQVSASGAIELQIVLEPSERLLALVSALRARDWKRFCAEIKGHNSGSVSG